MGYELGESKGAQMLIEDSIGRRILDAAIEIIKREGYDNLTIRKVAKESGCSNSAIYMRFEDKNALARAIAALHAKPFLLIMDENYVPQDSYYKNMKRITTKSLEHIYQLDYEVVQMQLRYRGELKWRENPFLIKQEEFLRRAATKGEIRVSDFEKVSCIISSSFWGLAATFRANPEIDLESAKKLLNMQNDMLYKGLQLRRSDDADLFWDSLREKGVDVDKALERMKGNKEAYRVFLGEFFEDPDFDNLKKSIKERNAREAFDYAHGLKGMAANLGLDSIHSKLSVLVEILRQGSLTGTEQAYQDVEEACSMVTELLV